MSILQTKPSNSWRTSLDGCVGRALALPHALGTAPSGDRPRRSGYQPVKPRQSGANPDGPEASRRSPAPVDDDLPADGSSQQLSDATWFSVSLTRTQKEWLDRIAGLCGVSLQQLLTGLVLWHWRLPWERLGEPPAGGRQDHVRILLDHRQWRRLKLLAAEAKLQIGDYLQSASLGRVRAPAQRVVPWLLSTAEVELRRVIHCLAEHGWRDGHHLPGHGLATQLETCANRIERACFELPESDREYTRELTRLTRILRAQRQMALGTKDTWAQIDAVMEKLQKPK